jgi:predicted aldo/keto reductase-like oxidoreductase
MRRSLEQACRELGRDYIDIFMLHEQVSALTLRGHADALACLVDAKRQGLIRAVGVSTHSVAVVRAAAVHDQIDVIHPLLNRDGIGIPDGRPGDMLAAIATAAAAGKGIYTMKALGGGHLLADAAGALRWVLAQAGISAVAVGMQSEAEVSFNCAVFSGATPDARIAAQVGRQPRRLLVEDWCQGCGRCADKCPTGAMSVVAGKAVCDPAGCLLCGYCGAYCPDFCLKII